MRLSWKAKRRIPVFHGIERRGFAVSGAFRAAQEYNEELYRNRQAGFTSISAYQEPSLCLSDYGIDDGVFGTVCIPKLGVTLPIYLGASEENMAKGAAHLSQTSLPIGGDKYNCVLAGHCGFNGADYFLYLSTLTEGDEVILTTLWVRIITAYRASPSLLRMILPPS